MIKWRRFIKEEPDKERSIIAYTGDLVIGPFRINPELKRDDCFVLKYTAKDSCIEHQITHVFKREKCSWCYADELGLNIGE